MDEPSNFELLMGLKKSTTIAARTPSSLPKPKTEERSFTFNLNSFEKAHKQPMPTSPVTTNTRIGQEPIDAET